MTEITQDSGVTYEYDQSPFDLRVLNEKGLDGWEAVGIARFHNIDNGAEWDEHWVLLKRPVPPKDSGA